MIYLQWENKKYFLQVLGDPTLSRNPGVRSHWYSMMLYYWMIKCQFFNSMNVASALSLSLCRLGDQHGNVKYDEFPPCFLTDQHLTVVHQYTHFKLIQMKRERV